MLTTKTIAHDVWFKAAVIIFPLCGAIILLALIVWAIKMLKKDSTYATANKLSTSSPTHHCNIINRTHHNKRSIDCDSHRGSLDATTIVTLSPMSTIINNDNSSIHDPQFMRANKIFQQQLQQQQQYQQTYQQTYPQLQSICIFQDKIRMPLDYTILPQNYSDTKFILNDDDADSMKQNIFLNKSNQYRDRNFSFLHVDDNEDDGDDEDDENENDGCKLPIFGD